MNRDCHEWAVRVDRNTKALCFCYHLSRRSKMTIYRKKQNKIKTFTERIIPVSRLKNVCEYMHPFLIAYSICWTKRLLQQSRPLDDVPDLSLSALGPHAMPSRYALMSCPDVLPACLTGWMLRSLDEKIYGLECLPVCHGDQLSDLAWPWLATCQNPAVEEAGHRVTGMAMPNTLSLPQTLL